MAFATISAIAKTYSSGTTPITTSGNDALTVFAVSGIADPYVDRVIFRNEGLQPIFVSTDGGTTWHRLSLCYASYPQVLQLDINTTLTQIQIKNGTAGSNITALYVTAFARARYHETRN